MLGRSHIASGILISPLAYSLYLDYSGAEVSIPTLIATAGVAAAASLIPDADHPNGTISHTFGPISYWATRIIAAVSGGHRAGTHSLLFVALMAAASWFAPPSVIAVLCGILAGILVRGLGLFPAGFAQKFRAIFASVVAIGVGTVVWALNMPMEWFPWAFTAGVIVHLLGDTLTPGGVPYLYPHPFRLSIPILSATGSTAETLILTPLMFIGGIVGMVLLVV